MRTQLKKKEKVTLTIRKHWIILIGPLFWTLIFLIIYSTSKSDFFLIGAVITSVWFIYRIFERNLSLWVVTNLRVIYEYGVFSNNSKETPLDKINNVSYKQPYFGIIFNYGNVQIQSAAEYGATVHKMLEKPKTLRDTISQNQENYKQEQIKKQAEILAKAVGGQKTSVKTDISEELTKLHDLMEKGIITEKDFQKRKEKILNN